MKLGGAIVADASAGSAQALAARMGELSVRIDVAMNEDHLDELLSGGAAELLVASVEFFKRADESLYGIHERYPHLAIFANYRELSVRKMTRLQDIGIDRWLEAPVRSLELYRAASTYFGRPFRRHRRVEVEVDILRADGKKLGKTVDLSEGGMLLRTEQTLEKNTSMLMDLDVGDTQALRVRGRVIAARGTDNSTYSVEFENVLSPYDQRLESFLVSLV